MLHLPPQFWLLVTNFGGAGLTLPLAFAIALWLTVGYSWRLAAVWLFLLGVALIANVLGASISGVIGDLFGWRGVQLLRSEPVWPDWELQAHHLLRPGDQQRRFRPAQGSAGWRGQAI